MNTTIYNHNKIKLSENIDSIWMIMSAEETLALKYRKGQQNYTEYHIMVDLLSQITFSTIT